MEVEAELTGRIQWLNKYTHNYDYLPNYTQLSNNLDGYGNTKPSFKSDEKISTPKFY